MRKRAATLAALAALAATGAAASVWSSTRPDWQQTPWPYQRDAWPPGLAFTCTNSACGGHLAVTIRPKLGFCNCATGVAGDAEVDVVTDLDLITETYAPQAPGQPITIDHMAGRMRAYTLNLPGGHTERAAGIAVSHRCDVVVTSARGDAPDGATAREAITRLMESSTVSAWLHKELGKG
jgi:hypothetical protein